MADNYFTGSRRNIEQWIGHENFELLHHDIVNPLYIEVDEIYHLASPASPPHYMYNPVKTIKTNIRKSCTPRHVPALVLAAPDIPRTISGKKVEIAVTRVLHNEPVANRDALKNPESLNWYASVKL